MKKGKQVDMENAKEGSERTEFRIVGETEVDVAYANFAQINITSVDAVITFARIDPATASKNEEDRVTTIDAISVARIFLPRDILEALHEAIGAQLRRDREKETPPDEE